jgi:hypothetical protein
MAAKFHDARKHLAQTGIPFGFAVPLGENSDRNFDIPPKLFRRMTAQEEAVEKGRLALREIEVVLRVFDGGRRGRETRIGFSMHRRHDANWQFTGTLPAVKYQKVLGPKDWP